MINRVLTLCEYIILHDEIDEVVDRGALIDLLKNKLKVNCAEEEIDCPHLIDLLIQVIKTDEFKAVLKTDEFQKLYSISYPNLPSLRDYISRFFESDIWAEVVKTNAWINLIQFDLFQKISIIFDSLNEIQRTVIFQAVIDLGRETSRYLRLSNLALKIENYIFVEAKSKKIINIQLFDKTFDYNLSRASGKKIRAYLQKNLNNDKDKDCVIEETLASSLALKELLMSEESASANLVIIMFLEDFIYCCECPIINYYFEERKKDSHLYKSLICVNPSLYISVIDLCLCLFSGDIPGVVDGFNNDYSGYWLLYAFASLEEERAFAVERMKNQILGALGKTNEILSIPAEASPTTTAKPENKSKVKIFQHNKNFLGALARQKADNTGRPIIDVCREVVEEWHDKKDKEIDPTGLANNFAKSLVNYGYKPENFYKRHRKILAKIKKEINWKE